MNQSVGSPVRTFLTAGVGAAMVGAVAVAPVTVSHPATVAAPIHMVAPHIQLASAGETIIAAYTAIQPWVAYGFELADYALSFVPGLWWIAPAVDLAYFTGQPLVEAGVYSFAYLIDGNWTLIGPTIQIGIQNSVTNFVNYGIAWIGSLIPLPPLPPLPPFPGAAVKAPAARAVGPRAAAAVVAQAETAVAETAEAVAPSATVTAPRSRRDARPAASHTPRPSAPAAAVSNGGSSRADQSASKASAAKSGRGA